MLKSQELKNDFVELQQRIQALVDAEQEVPADMVEELTSIKAEYEKEKNAEMSAKKIQKENVKMKMEQNVFNKVLRDVLAKRPVDADLLAKSGLKGVMDEVGSVGAVEGVPARGGYLVPEEYLGLEKNQGDFVMIPMRIVPVSKPEGSMPVIDLSQAKKAGKFMAKHDELSTIGKDNPVFGNIPFKAVSYTGIVPVSVDLNEDSEEDLGEVIGEVFGMASKAQENAEAIAKLNAANTIPVVKFGSNKDFTHVEAIKAVVKAVRGKLTGANRANAKVVVCDSDFASLATITNQNGDFYLKPMATDATRYQIDGVEVISIADECMTVGEGEEAVIGGYGYVGNFNKLACFERKGLEVSADLSNMFDLDAVAIKGKKRFDVQLLDPKAFVKLMPGA